VGALPILNQFLRRMRLEDFLRSALPPEDRRMKFSPVKALLVLLRNLLVSREPIYGVGEWAARYAADALGLTQQEIGRLNDDGVGRALDRLFMADVPSLVLAVATHVVKEFGVSLDELHNDSTTVTFCGAYTQATAEQRYLGQHVGDEAVLAAEQIGHQHHRRHQETRRHRLHRTATRGDPVGDAAARRPRVRPERGDILLRQEDHRDGRR